MKTMLAMAVFSCAIGCANEATPTANEESALSSINFIDQRTAAQFAYNEVYCDTIACQYPVPGNDYYQFGYECAEYVSRSLAAGDGLPGVTAYGSQIDSLYLGKYNLKWVSSKGPNYAGGPPSGTPGLSDYLDYSGEWDVYDGPGLPPGGVQQGDVVFTWGTDKNNNPIPWGHVVLGVGDNIVDSHNVSWLDNPISKYNINAVYRAKGIVCPGWTNMGTWGLLSGDTVTLWKGCGVYHATATGVDGNQVKLDNGYGISSTATISGGSAKTANMAGNPRNGQVRVCAMGVVNNRWLTNCTGYFTP